MILGESLINYYNTIYINITSRLRCLLLKEIVFVIFSSKFIKETYRLSKDIITISKNTMDDKKKKKNSSIS